MLAQPRGVAAGGEERAAAIGPTNHREMTMTGADYVHGYSGGEAERLTDQADVLAALLHDGIAFPAGDSVLEPGCGVGSQTVHLAARSPGVRIVALDVSPASLTQARRRVADAGFSNVTFQRGAFTACRSTTSPSTTSSSASCSSTCPSRHGPSRSSAGC